MTKGVWSNRILYTKKNLHEQHCKNRLFINFPTDNFDTYNVRLFFVCVFFSVLFFCIRWQQDTTTEFTLWTAQWPVTDGPKGLPPSSYSERTCPECWHTCSILCPGCCMLGSCWRSSACPRWTGACGRSSGFSAAPLSFSSLAHRKGSECISALQEGNVVCSLQLTRHINFECQVFFPTYQMRILVSVTQ